MCHVWRWVALISAGLSTLWMMCSMKLDLLQFLFLKVDERWLMEGIVDTGRMKIGLPGLASLYLSASPSFGAVLGIYRNRSVGRLPLLPYTAMVCNSVIWMFYGVTSKQFAVAAPNLLGLVLGLVYCGVYCWHAPTDADWPHRRGLHLQAVVVAAMLCLFSSKLPGTQGTKLLGGVGFGATIVMFAGPLASIRTVLNSKNTKSLPFGFTCAMTVNCALWTYYATVLADPVIFTANAIGLLLAMAQLSLFAHFGIS